MKGERYLLKNVVINEKSFKESQSKRIDQEEKSYIIIYNHS